MNDKFVLIRKRPAPPRDERKMLSVRDSTYNIVAGWYEALGRTTSMTDIVGLAIQFAAEHVVFVDEESGEAEKHG